MSIGVKKIVIFFYCRLINLKKNKYNIKKFFISYYVQEINYKRNSYTYIGRSYN